MLNDLDINIIKNIYKDVATIYGIGKELGIPPNLIRNHIIKLEKLNLVKFIKTDGKKVYYTNEDNVLIGDDFIKVRVNDKIIIYTKPNSKIDNLVVNITKNV